MITLNQQDLLKAGVHLGHLSRKWNPNMAPFIFMESRGIHIIDLNKTLLQLQKATDVLQATARVGKKILFVATKKQAKELVAQTAKALNMPYMTERWLGGTLTNFITLRRLIKKLTSMDRMMKSASYKNMAKKEQLKIARNQANLQRVLIGILDLNKLPGALVVVDIVQESIAVREANKLHIPVIALTDTNANPNLVDYPIPSNDDAIPAIDLLIRAIGDAISTGLAMRQESKALEEQEKQIQEDEEGQNLPARELEKMIYSEGDLEEDGHALGPKVSKNKPLETVEKFKKNKLTESVPPKTDLAKRPRKRVTGLKLQVPVIHNSTTVKPSTTKIPIQRMRPSNEKSKIKETTTYTTTTEKPLE